MALMIWSAAYSGVIEMYKVNLVVMGKTGAGKSTLINSVLKEDLAPTGAGQAVTRKNCIYSKKMLLPVDPNPGSGKDREIAYRTLNLYDTVGLEIDASITEKTLHHIKELLKKAQENEEENDISLVWFCVNSRSDRFESYEAELIRSLSIEYEIPFVLVLTQCISDETSKLEEAIKKDFPEIPTMRVLAKDYRPRDGVGVISAYGTTELLQKSIRDFADNKIRILESKLDGLLNDRTQRIEKMRIDGKACIDSYSRKAGKIGFIPGGCIPAVHTMCIAMLNALNKIVGINAPKGLAYDMFTNAMLGVIVTPLMLVPLLSAAAAGAYVEVIGGAYLDALISVIEQSTDAEIADNDLMAERIKAEIRKRKENDHG